MALHLRKRGEIYHARGTVRVGRETIIVTEHSTGCRTLNDAKAAAAAEEARIRSDALDGGAGRARRLTIADCFAAYLKRPGGLKDYDAARIADLNEAMGARPLEEAPDAWRDWMEAHPDQAPATLARTRSTLSAALNAGAAAHKIQPPKLLAVRVTEPDRFVYLKEGERAKLLAAYNPWAACPALLLAYQGLRTQEALRLDWRHVDLKRRTIHIVADQVKTRRGRTLPLHPRVDALLFGMWNGAGCPESGPVFLSQRGKPYADTRGREGGLQGGNPLSQAHDTACGRAGVSGFRVHDWRHDWAARVLMSGADLETLRRMGGWTSYRMVGRYTVVTESHMAEAIARIG